MLSPVTMNSGNGSNGEAESDFSSQNIDTSLGRETMLQLLQSRQRAMRAQLESLSAQGGLNMGDNSLQGGINFGQGGMSFQNDAINHDDPHDESHLEFHSDASHGFQGGLSSQGGFSSQGGGMSYGGFSSQGGGMSQGGITSEQIAHLTNTGGGSMANSNMPYMGGMSDHSPARGMSAIGDANMEDELLRLLLARRQRLRSTAASLGHNISPSRASLRTSESAPSALESGNIQSLTDELLRNYSRNRTSGGMGSSFPGQQQQEDSFQSHGDMNMDQHQPFPPMSSHRSSSLPGPSIFQQEMQRRELQRSSSLPAPYSQEMRYPQDSHRLDDTSGVIDLIDAPERIEPMPMSVQDIMMRDHLKMREQQHFMDSDDRKRFLESRRTHSSSAINFGQLEGFDFGPAVNAKIEQAQESSPKKRKKSPRKKPADMPRRPLSAYNLFFSEERERILLELSDDKDLLSLDITSGEQTPTGTETSAEIKSDPSSEEEDAAGDEDKKQPASPKVEEGAEGGGDSPSSSKANIQALLRPLIPSQKKRRPHRKTHGKIGFQSLARLVGERWRNLPEDRKQYYKDLAKEDMKRQKIAMDEYYRKQEKSKKKPPAEGSSSAKKEEDMESDKPAEGKEVSNTLVDEAAKPTGEEEDVGMALEVDDTLGKASAEASKQTGEETEAVEEAIKSIEEGVTEEAKSSIEASQEEIEFLKEEEKVTEKEEKEAEGGDASYDSMNMAAV